MNRREFNDRIAERIGEEERLRREARFSRQPERRSQLFSTKTNTHLNYENINQGGPRDCQNVRNRK